MSETESGGELTVDHFVPVSAGGDDSPENLVYACFRCNTFKGDRLPTAPEPPERRIIHPLLGTPEEHYVEEEASGLLVALTATGTAHIEALRLNREALVRSRLRRRIDALLANQNDLAREDNARYRLMIERLLELLDTLLREVGARGGGA